MLSSRDARLVPSKTYQIGLLFVHPVVENYSIIVTQKSSAGPPLSPPPREAAREAETRKASHPPLITHRQSHGRQRVSTGGDSHHGMDQPALLHTPITYKSHLDIWDTKNELRVNAGRGPLCANTTGTFADITAKILRR